ncbi:MAG: SPOR domain-containing protein [Prosthecobacter sp.]
MRSSSTLMNAQAATYDLFREDDNGARFLIARYASREEAEEFADELTRRGHKQLYFVETEDVEALSGGGS